MGNLVVAEPRLKTRPFGTFVLAGAHDAGMFDTFKIEELLHSAGYVALVGLVVALLQPLKVIPVLGPLLTILIDALLATKALPADAQRIMVNLAFTQKDDVRTQLNLGTRYFDFRPGYLQPTIRTAMRDDALYHQHLFVPGYPYSKFLTDVLEWLETHPAEVVVVRNSSAGFADHDTMTPSDQTLQQYLRDAQGRTKSTVTIGDQADLKATYEHLVDKAVNKRLLFLDKASQYDSYDDNSYATTDPSTVIRKLETMSSAGQVGKDFTSLQLQATSTNIKEVLAWGALATTDATCPLLSTKARFDHSIYPWLLNDLPRKSFNREQLLVLLNDFVDNALTSRAIELTRNRV